MVSIRHLCLLLAFLFFVLAAFGVPSYGKLNYTAVGLGFFALSFLEI